MFKDELWVVHDYRERLSAYFRPTENTKKACRHISCTKTRHELYSTFTLLAYTTLVSLTCTYNRENVNVSEYKSYKPCYKDDLQVERSRVRFTIVSLEFFIDLIFLAALWPCDQLSL